MTQYEVHYQLTKFTSTPGEHIMARTWAEALTLARKHYPNYWFLRKM